MAFANVVWLVLLIANVTGPLQVPDTMFHESRQLLARIVSVDCDAR